MKKYTRRNWLQLTAMANAAVLLPMGLFPFGESKANSKNRLHGKEINTVLVVSGWQDVNIGDIAHTPGLLHVLQTFMPKTEIILWRRSSGEEVDNLIQGHFPNIRIIHGKVDEDKNIDSPEVLDCINKADLLIHGSGPHVVGQDNLEAWRKITSKPYGIFGTTIEEVDDSLKTVLKNAAFVYTRETDSLKVLKENGLAGDHISFAPDATFYMDITDEAKANEFMKSKGLEPKKFICAIPRLRKTPYYKFRPNNAGWSDEKIREVEELNDSKKEIDSAKMREAMIAWVRETGNKVLVCPEMTYVVDLMDEMLIDPLPDDVKPYVVKHGYWMPDEAASVYKQAHTVLSMECHSPIIAAYQGTPTFYLRQPQDTIKGQMWYDLGYEDWVFEIEQTTGKQITNTLRDVWTDYGAAEEKVKVNMKKVEDIYADRTDEIKTILG